jgi:hypothetical protein
VVDHCGVSSHMGCRDAPRITSRAPNLLVPNQAQTAPEPRLWPPTSAGPR